MAGEDQNKELKEGRIDGVGVVVEEVVGTIPGDLRTGQSVE